MRLITRSALVATIYLTTAIFALPRPPRHQTTYSVINVSGQVPSTVRQTVYETTTVRRPPQTVTVDEPAPTITVTASPLITSAPSGYKSEPCPEESSTTTTDTWWPLPSSSRSWSESVQAYSSIGPASFSSEPCPESTAAPGWSSAPPYPTQSRNAYGGYAHPTGGYPPLKPTGYATPTGTYGYKPHGYSGPRPTGYYPVR